MDEYIRWIRFMPNSIKPSLMRPACGYAWISRDDIMENIIYYGEYHNTDSPRTKEDFKKLWGKLDSLPIKNSNA